MYSKILATGSYLPSKILTNFDLEKMVETNDAWITQRTGIKQRHIADEFELTSDLAVTAGLEAIQRANLEIQDIDAIIVATSTPDQTFPSVATQVQAKLGLKRGFAFDIQAVCSGFIYALSVADSMIVSGKAKTILLIGAEIFSRIIDYTDRNTCILFGDGAGAVILTATPDNPNISSNSGIIGVELFSDGIYNNLLRTTGGPASTKTTGVVEMQGGEVFKHATIKLIEGAKFILEKYQYTYQDINWLIPHQANLRIIEAVAKKLNLSVEKIIITVDKHANTSAASIPLALDYALKQDLVKRGDLILMDALGAGFTWGAALVRY